MVGLISTSRWCWYSQLGIDLVITSTAKREKVAFLGHSCDLRLYSSGPWSAQSHCLAHRACRLTPAQNGPGTSPRRPSAQLPVTELTLCITVKIDKILKCQLQTGRSRLYHIGFLQERNSLFSIFKIYKPRSFVCSFVRQTKRPWFEKNRTESCTIETLHTYLDKIPEMLHVLINVTRLYTLQQVTF